MNRLAEIIRKLPGEDVLLIKQDLDEGNIGRLISERLAELELPQRVCPVCNTELDDNAPYVLYFGTGIRKKARFDALDCLKTFISEELE
jgi:DNA repair exonuclease SbcCD ATPase subunit